MPITDQVATAPCTDCVQAQHPTLETKLTRYREVVLTASNCDAIQQSASSVFD